jgi:CubicO group peptidase (beta-lactamase class C family)
MPGFDRRALLAGTGAMLAAHPLSPTLAAPFAWQAVEPSQAGFASDLAARLDKLIADERAWNLHGVLVARGRRIVLERYFEGEDNVRGIGRVGRVAFGPDTLHDLRSVTKSIVGLLYGVALAARKVPAPDAPLFAQFPRYADLVEADPRRKRLTIAHALTMTLGTAWDESTYPYSDPRNSETAMDLAADRYRYILGLAVTEEPGGRWLYSGGATALIGRIITEGVGGPLTDFARAALFDPLGIGKTTWAAGPDGEPFAASGLRMTPRDLARIGQLLLDKGQADGREIVPSDWLAQSFMPRAAIDEARRYGYHWYVGDVSFGAPERRESWIGAIGNGGQRLFVLPGLDLVVVITAGNYNRPNQSIPLNRVMREVVLAGLP